MRKFFPYILFLGLFLVYSFFTLPLLLPVPQHDKLADRYDAIIVLGGGLTSDCNLNASLQARMDKGIELYRNSYSTRIILTGGLQLNSEDCFESEAMSAYALRQNVPAEVLIKENKALNTYQNAFYSTSMMKKRGMKTALIVTSEFHLKRANIIFDKYNIDYEMVPSVSLSEGLRRYKELGKEQLLLCFHSLFGIPDRFGLDLKEQNFREVFKSFALN